MIFRKVRKKRDYVEHAGWGRGWDLGVLVCIIGDGICAPGKSHSENKHDRTRPINAGPRTDGWVDSKTKWTRKQLGIKIVIWV